MSSPPPASKQIKFIRFEGNAMGFTTEGMDRRKIEKAQQKAQDWINQNPQVEIISIDSAFGNLLAITTVWYRE